MEYLMSFNGCVEAEVEWKGTSIKRGVFVALTSVRPDYRLALASLIFVSSQATHLLTGSTRHRSYQPWRNMTRRVANDVDTMCKRSWYDKTVEKANFYKVSV